MTVNIAFIILTCKIATKFTKADLTGSIIGGEFSKVSAFPYSAFVHIKRDDKESFCSGSILNQAFILTAAHCIFSSHVRRLNIRSYTGSAKKRSGFMSKVDSFKIHGYFNEITLQSDIALLRLEKHLTLGMDSKRIIVMSNPPKAETAMVAGWGVFNDLGIVSDVLRHSNQQLINQETCKSIVDDLPIGTLCAQEERYPDRGDSGSALVIVNNSIQIGMVSFKKIPNSNKTIVYTDVSFYEHWIRDVAYEMYCETVLKRLKKKERLKCEKKAKGKRWKCICSSSDFRGKVEVKSKIYGYS